MTRPSRRTPAAGEVTDAQLVARVASGDADALAAVYDRHSAACYGLARRILNDEGLAQDVVQEVFVALWRNPARFDPTKGRFDTWLMSVTHHRAVDAVRREQPHRSRRTTADSLEWTPSDAPAPPDLAWIGVQRDAVDGALRALPHAQRESLVLAYYGGYTQREIAGILDVPLGTVKSRMFTGLARLRELLPPSLLAHDGGDR